MTDQKARDSLTRWQGKGDKGNPFESLKPFKSLPGYETGDHRSEPGGQELWTRQWLANLNPRHRERAEIRSGGRRRLTVFLGDAITVTLIGQVFVADKQCPQSTTLTIPLCTFSPQRVSQKRVSPGSLIANNPTPKASN